MSIAYDAGLSAVTGLPSLPERTVHIDLDVDLIDLRTSQSLSSHSDEELLAVRNGDLRLFGEFYDRHNESVLKFVMRRTACAQTAADLTAETFAVAFAKRGSFDPSRGAAGAWLYGIARNQILNFNRRERRRLKLLRRAGGRAQLTDDDMHRVEELADMPSVRSDVVAAMELLPASQAEAVRLRIVEQLSYADTAKQLGISEGAARVRVSRGLNRLADALSTPGTT